MWFADYLAEPGVLYSINQSVNTVVPTNDPVEPPGEKLDPDEVVEGKGLSRFKKGDHKLNDKYFINLHNLDNNVLAVRYNKNRHLTNIKHQVIGGALKNTIKNVISVGKLDLGDYNKLQEQEKDILNRFLVMIDRHDLVKNDDSMQKEFETLWGSFMAGNNNDVIKQKLKMYITHAMSLNIINKQTGLIMLHQLII